MKTTLLNIAALLALAGLVGCRAVEPPVLDHPNVTERELGEGWDGGSFGDKWEDITLDPEPPPMTITCSIPLNTCWYLQDGKWIKSQ